jgi:hypothetical protein
MRFDSILQMDVPKSREGKHKNIIFQLLDDIERLPAGSALKIPLAGHPDTKENIRAASEPEEAPYRDIQQQRLPLHLEGRRTQLPKTWVPERSRLASIEVKECVKWNRNRWLSLSEWQISLGAPQLQIRLNKPIIVSPPRPLYHGSVVGHWVRNNKRSKTHGGRGRRFPSPGVHREPGRIGRICTSTVLNRGRVP